MDELGFLGDEKSIPGWVLGLPLGRLKWFVEGYREGDGVHSGIKFEEAVRHEFSTVSTRLKDDLVIALGRFGLVPSVGRYETTLRQRTGDRRYPFWRLTISRCSPWSPLDWDRGVEQTLQSRRCGDLVFAGIKEILEVEPTQLVYDFCVPGTENFLAGTAVMAHNTYGPRLRPADGRVVSNFLVQAMRGEPLTVFGDGKQTRSFCFVDDEIRGLHRAARIRPRRPGEHREPERVHDPRARRGGHRRHRIELGDRVRAAAGRRPDATQARHHAGRRSSWAGRPRSSCARGSSGPTPGTEAEFGTDASGVAGG